MIELAQFHEMFFDECEELLNRADMLLPECSPVASPETLAELRRCAHSIKGGSATFAFACMTACATELERVLGLVLASGEQPESGTLGVCGEAFVVLRELASCQRCGTESDGERMAQVLNKLESVGAPGGVDKDKAEACERGCCYEFSFVLSRTVVGGDLLIEDMLERLGCVGRVVSTIGPEPENRDGRWRLQVVAAPGVTEAALCEIVGRLADPESLRMRAMQAEAADLPISSSSGADKSRADGGVVSHETAAHAQVGGGAPVPPALRAHGTEQIERRAPIPISYLVFGVGGQRYAARADEVVEVRACANLQPLAGAPKAVLGVVDVRGEYVPVIDSRNCLGVTAASPTSLTPVMMLRVESGLVGVLVDEIGDIVAVEASTMQAPHRLLATRGFVQIVGLSRYEGQLLTIIDLVTLVRSVGLARSGMFAVA